MRAKGKILFDDTTVVHPVVEEAKRSQRQKQEEIRLRREARPEKPLLNRNRYPNLYAKWLTSKALGFSKLPPCPVCREATLQWDEPAHECEGFKPMYVEHDKEWHERMEQRREMIRESRLEDMRENRNIHYCDNCGEELLDEEHAMGHAENCPARINDNGDDERDSVCSEE